MQLNPLNQSLDKSLLEAAIESQKGSVSETEVKELIIGPDQPIWVSECACAAGGG